MTILVHELRRNRISLVIWSSVLSFMLGICILIYPEMSAQMNEISEMFADMGSFSSAFGMDQVNFGEFMGYFAVECGNVLGIGGALFAAISGISILGKEEKDHTAEFLLTHPISRARIVLEKLMSLISQIIILNLIVAAITCGAILVIDVKADVGKTVLILLAYFLLQIEIGAITFGISAFLKNGGIGFGLGIAVIFYFMNIIANLSENVEFLKYLTPFGYTDGADIVANGAINFKHLSVGAVFTICGIIFAFWRYCKKDIS